MAYCKIKSVKNNLKRVIDYVANSEKTDEDIYLELHKELNYVAKDSKTENKLYVDGINCDPTRAREEFINIKERYNKTKGIIAFHAIVSYKPGETTPDEAHSVGLEIANQMWGDRFQVVVATHLDREHLHNHFIINSVSIVDGKRYYDTRTSYAEFRRLCNQICKEHNLSYMEEKKTKSGINYLNYQKKSDQSNYSKQTKSDVDMAIALANSYPEFITILENMNYEVTERANKLSVRDLEYDRNIRIERRFGEDYTIDNIKKQILGLYLPEKKTYYKNYFQRDSVIDNLFKMNCKGLAMRYIKYLKLLNNYPTYIKRNRVSYSMRLDVMKMEKISDQTVLLANNNITSKEDLINLYKSIKEKLHYNPDNNELKNEILLINEIRRREELLEDNSKENKKEVVIHEPVK